MNLIESICRGLLVESEDLVRTKLAEIQGMIKAKKGFCVQTAHGLLGREGVLAYPNKGVEDQWYYQAPESHSKAIPVKSKDLEKVVEKELKRVSMNDI